MKCRFAPSPTGNIHIGNARSAILNWIFCQKNKGEFILRIDDTDINRSSKEFETSIKKDLKWLGLNWSSTFNQSSRNNIYNEKIQILKQKKRLYPCFETEEELALKKKSLLSSGKPPIYDRASLILNEDEIQEKIQAGIKPHWRFKLEHKNISWNDIIKGEVSFDAINLSDPVLIRADGSLLYHLPSVIDDIMENITHIIRGEDHIANTAFHIQIFQALESNIPSFAHHPFLVDDTGKGFSKRLGSLSIENFRNEGYENISLINYFLFIGSSSNIEPMKDLNKIINKFDIHSLSKSSAKFSIESLKNLNENTIKLFNYDEINHKLININSDFQNEIFWRFIKNNISFIKEAKEWEGVITKINNAKDFNIDDSFINTAIDELPEDPFDEKTWDNWTSKINIKTGLKGKDLFMPLRLILTGKSHGPELKYLIPLFNKNGILQKLGKI
ncbi:MAG: glutamate--tRNA ligase [Pelagibacteraceae bacterium TMED237]|nr:MAG: glutamate--tRNA ligase [Pelagibacteraceae bacterium TMED237]|tara:strand:- start:770 stop:2104 length:1335 start_codon:yes stop_codon:yes gene_type:complete